MAAGAGKVKLVLEFAEGLKDKDWFGKQDPYAVVTCGNQHYRSRTCVDGGTKPVWNEEFEFSVLEEKEINVKLMDEDVGSDDHLGSGTVSLAAVRQRGTDRQAVQLYSRKNHARGTLHVSLTFTPNGMSHPAGQYPPQGQYPAPGQYPPAAQYPPASYYPPPGQYPPPSQYPPPTGPPAPGYGHVHGGAVPAHCGPGHKPKKAKKGVLRNVLEGVVAGVLEGALKGHKW